VNAFFMMHSLVTEQVNDSHMIGCPTRVKITKGTNLTNPFSVLLHTAMTYTYVHMSSVTYDLV
jgi:hypothetical protein